MENVNTATQRGAMSKTGLPLQLCPLCAATIGALPGGRDAVCHNCGYKDPCCE